MRIRRRLIRQLESRTERTIRALPTLLALFIGAMLLSVIFVTSINEHIRAQDTMLCASALRSGNEVYQKRCQCYYASGNVECVVKK